MNVFVAGASGAIGMPLLKELVEHGHHVTAMSRSAGLQPRTDKGSVNFVQVDAFDRDAVFEAVRRSAPHAVIDLLTSLPKKYEDLPKAFPGDRQLRLEGGLNLFEAAINSGAKRYLQQSSGFYLKPDHGELATEEDGFQLGAGTAISLGSQMLRTLEDRALKNAQIEGIALRYGFFYGPGTWYTQDGGAAHLARQGSLAIIGEGRAVNSFIHVDDAAVATAAALHAAPGAYNIVDDEPIAVAQWLPAFARYVGAPPPSRISEEEALQTMGEDAVFYHNGLKGARNDKAKRELGFRPRPLEWLTSTDTPTVAR